MKPFLLTAAVLMTAFALTIHTPVIIVRNVGLDFATVTSGAPAGAVAIGANNYLRAVDGGVGNGSDIVTVNHP